MSTFLYKTGDECIDITGGFISSPYTLTGTSVEVIKNSDNMQLNPNGSGRHTTLSHNTAIDLTEYKSIYFDIEVVSALGGNQWTRLGLSTNNNQNDYGVGEVTIENTVGRKIYYIDLTDKTGLAFVKAHINCGTGAVSPFMNIKIYNIWLEENLEKLPVSTDLSNAIQYNENINSKISTLKIKLENNLIQKGVQCSKTDKMSSLIDKVNNISLESLGGKKWASGVSIVSSRTNLFYTLNGTYSSSCYYFDIPLLEFKPSNVVFIGKASSSISGYVSNLTQTYVTNEDMYINVYSKYTNSSSTSATTVGYKASGNVFQDNVAMRIPCIGDTSIKNIEVSWIAFE